MKRRLSGIKPTGRIHLGNYFGAIKRFIETQNSNSLYFVADYHALTTLPARKELAENSLGIILDYLALGLTESTIFLQSSIKEHAELALILSNLTPIALLQRSHAYKDKLAKQENINAGLFNYPVLMSADILMYNPDLVPVGKDQKQHVEIARDLAIKFNLEYGDIFKIPEPEIIESSSVIGIDGRKMSKSYGNTIEIFGSEDEIRKQVFSIVTDSKGIHEKKDYEQCIIYNILKLFLNESERKEIEEKYLTSVSYKYLKDLLLDKILEFSLPLKRVRDELKFNLDYVDIILKTNSDKAKKIAASTMEKVKAACGLIGGKY